MMLQTWYRSMEDECVAWVELEKALRECKLNMYIKQVLKVNELVAFVISFIRVWSK